MDIQAKEQAKVIKVRYLPDYNYEAVWSRGYTVRLDKGPLKELPIELSEFYDVSVGTYCPNNCPFCYVSAKDNGRYYKNLAENWKKLVNKLWWSRKISGLTVTNKPFQIAIGSNSEPTNNPELPEFLKAVKETDVIPNYTTAGNVLGYKGNDGNIIKLRDNLLEATEKYCAAVAISLGNNQLRDSAFRAIEVLKGKCLVTLHHIISDPSSVHDFLSLRAKFKPGEIHYHVLLPLVKSGRSKDSITQQAYITLEEELSQRKKKEEDISDIAFGAKFIPFLEKSNKLNIKTFPEQTYSKNLLLTEEKAIFTRSSFDLRPIKEINYDEV